MAKETIKIFELDLDVDAALKTQEELAKKLNATKTSLEALKKSGDTTSRTYLEMDAQVKNLNKEYQASQRQIGKMLELQGKEIKTVEQARNSLSILNREWAKQASAFGINSKEADKLAGKTKEVRERLKELDKGVGDNTRNVGNYTDSMKEALGQFSLFGKAQDIMAKGQIAVASATKVANGSLRSFKTVLAATGIGLLILALGSVIGLLAGMRKTLSRTEEGQGKLNKITAIFTGILNGVFKVLEPLANFIFDKVVLAFERAGQAAEAAAEGIQTALRFFGFDEAADKLEKFTEQTKESVKATEAYEAANQKLLKTQREQEKVKIQFQRREEKLRQIRDDESKSTKERIEANEQLGKVLDQQIQAELKLAKQALQVANLRIAAEGENTEALDQRAAALTKIEEIQERVEGQRSEQLTNTNSLIKEQTALNQERSEKAINAAIKEKQDRLNLFIEENRGKSQILEESLAKETEIKERKLSLLDEEVKAGKKTLTEAELEKLKIKGEYLQRQTDLENEYADKVEERIVDKTEAFSNSLNQQLLELKRSFAEGTISEKQYEESLRSINIEALQEKKKLLKDIDQEILADQSLTNEQRIEMQADLKDQLIEIENEILDAKLEINQKQRDDDLKTFQERIAKQIEVMEFTQQSLGGLNSILKGFSDRRIQTIEEEKKSMLEAAKGNAEKQAEIEKRKNLEIAKEQRSQAIKERSFSVFSIFIETAKAVAKSLSASPVTFGQPWAGYAIAQGALQTAAVLSAPLPKAEKGAIFDIGGKRHSSGGTKFYGEDGTAFEAEQGEVLAVLNRNAAMAFNNLNKLYPAGSSHTGRNYFETGGIVERFNAPQSVKVNANNLDDATIERIALRIAEANKSLPRPITDVKDIISEVDNYNQVVNGANI